MPLSDFRIGRQSKMIRFCPYLLLAGEEILFFSPAISGDRAVVGRP